MKIATTHSYLLLWFVWIADAAHLPLVFAPESGNMLGGTVVNITGPCFDKNERVVCTFDTISVVGHVIEGDRNRAICVQPMLLAQGYVRFQISIGNDRFKWRGLYFVGMFSCILPFYCYVFVSCRNLCLWKYFDKLQRHQLRQLNAYFSAVTMFMKRHPAKFASNGINSI